MKNAPRRKTWQSYGNCERNAFRYYEIGHYTTFENLVYTQFYILGYTEGFSFQELPWSQRQAIFFESSQIGKIFHSPYMNMAFCLYKCDIER